MTSAIRVAMAAAMIVGSVSACGTTSEGAENATSQTNFEAEPSRPGDEAGQSTNEAPASEATDLHPPQSLQLTDAFLAEQPTDLVPRPGDSRLYVSQRSGTVVIFEPGRREPVGTLLDFSDEVGDTHDQAFMSLTFDASGNRLYVHFSRNGDGASVLRRYELDGDRFVSAEDLLVVDEPFPDHNGGSVRFGPDGYLYWALGDGGREVDARSTAQDTTNLLGSILRLDVSGASGYAVPPDNPYVDSAGRPEIWSYGLRNPWRIAFDPLLGDLWIADVGLIDAEEINLASASDGLGRGDNYGWPNREGTTGSEPAGGSVDPVELYDHREGRCSITGGEVYRGELLPDLAGEYLFGDFCSGEIMSYRPGASRRFTVYEPSLPQVVGFAADNDGELYVLAITGEISRLVAGAG